MSAKITEKSSETTNIGDQDLDRSFGIFKGPPRYTAEILFTGTAAELVKNQIWHKNQQMIEREDGTILKIPVHDDREIVMKTLQYGSSARVISPKQLFERIKSELEKMMKIYKK